MFRIHALTLTIPEVGRDTCLRRGSFERREREKKIIKNQKPKKKIDQANSSSEHSRGLLASEGALSVRGLLAGSAALPGRGRLRTDAARPQRPGRGGGRQRAGGGLPRDHGRGGRLGRGHGRDLGRGRDLRRGPQQRPLKGAGGVRGADLLIALFVGRILALWLVIIRVSVNRARSRDFAEEARATLVLDELSIFPGNEASHTKHQ